MSRLRDKIRYPSTRKTSVPAGPANWKAKSRLPSSFSEESATGRLEKWKCERVGRSVSWTKISKISKIQKVNDETKKTWQAYKQSDNEIRSLRSLSDCLYACHVFFVSSFTFFVVGSLCLFLFIPFSICWQEKRHRHRHRHRYRLE